MQLTRHATEHGARWAADGQYLAEGTHLAWLLQHSAEALAAIVAASRTGETATAPLLPPVDPHQEVWAAGVTYLRSREARMAESETADIYAKVYEAERVEVFFKALGWRVMGHGQAIRVRADSNWNAPEPELVLVLNAAGEIVGYTAGNDVSSRSIEGENPLYLPQAKVFQGSCALGPGIVLAGAATQADVPIRMSITRAGAEAFAAETSTSQLKRTLPEIAGWLTRELRFPEGVFLMTGTCLVPPDEFSLQAGDRVRIEVGNLVLENPVEP